mgnify:CR=1 FL=1
MSLSCQCHDYDGEGWSYWKPTEESTLQTKKARRCCSCNDLIKPGSPVVPFPRFRRPNSDIEERIHGDEVYLANWFMCEKCGDMYWSLDELGFCITLGEEMRELTREYAEVYGPGKRNSANA